MSVIQPHFGAVTLNTEKYHSPQRNPKTGKFLNPFENNTPSDDAELKSRITKANKKKSIDERETVPCCVCGEDIFTFTESLANGGEPPKYAIRNGPGPLPGQFLCQTHKNSCDRLVQALGDKIHPGGNSRNMRFLQGQSDVDERIQTLMYKYLKYRYTRVKQIGSTAGSGSWGSKLSTSANLTEFEEAIKEEIRGWYAQHGGGASSGSRSLSGGSSSLSGGSSSLSGEPAPYRNDVMLSMMKERFVSSTDEDIENVLQTYRERVIASRRDLPDKFWVDSLRAASDLDSFEATIMHEQTVYEQNYVPPAPVAEGRGMYAKGLFQAPGSPSSGGPYVPRPRGLGGVGMGKGLAYPDWNTRGSQGVASSSRGSQGVSSSSGTSIAGDDDGAFPDPDLLPPPHYPPPSPSGSISSASQFQPFGAPAEAFSSLRL